MHIKWGIIGTGNIARSFASGIKKSKSGSLYAVASRELYKAESFASSYGALTAYGSYQALLDDGKVDAVYICTPHPFHAEWIVKAAEAGKHILCEKPIALNHAEAMAAVQAARDNQVFLMEAYMYRCNPQTKAIIDIVSKGTLGRVRSIEASHSFYMDMDEDSRVFSRELAGGGIMDVGCYCMSFARLIAGVGQNQPYAEPVKMSAVGRLTETDIDAYTSAIMKFHHDIIATISTGVQLAQPNTATIYGSKGYLLIHSPWLCARDGGESHMYLHLNDKPVEEVAIHSERDIYAIEADTVAECIDAGLMQYAGMSWDDTLGNMRCLDNWRKEIGVIYPSEQIDGYLPPVDRLPLNVKQSPAVSMKYKHIPPLDKPVSRIILGAMPDSELLNLPYCSVMSDYYYEHGGNCFDTVNNYVSSDYNRYLAAWIKNRNIRDSIVLIGNGLLDPTEDQLHLKQTLDTLGTDYLDIYMLNGDSKDTPVEEYIDRLNEYVKQGRIRCFAANNWSIQRICEANEYAKHNGLLGFSAICNNLSLADMTRPVWDGAVCSNDTESRDWFAQHQMAVMSWSSLGQGFFPNGLEFRLIDRPMVKSWFSAMNFKRKLRVEKLAKIKGVEPVSIVLAWLFHQKFPTLAMVGPQTIEELAISMNSINTKLTDDEVNWLYSGEPKIL